MILKNIMTNVQNKFVVAVDVVVKCMLRRKLGVRRRYSQSFFSSGRIITLHHHFFIFWILGLTSSNYHFLVGFILTQCLNLLTFFESSSQFFGVLRMEKVTAADIFL